MQFHLWILCTITRAQGWPCPYIHRYTRYFWQGNHQIYGHIRCICTVLANPACAWCMLVWSCGGFHLEHPVGSFLLLLLKPTSQSLHLHCNFYTRSCAQNFRYSVCPASRQNRSTGSFVHCAHSRQLVEAYNYKEDLPVITWVRNVEGSALCSNPPHLL